MVCSRHILSDPLGDCEGGLGADKAAMHAECFSAVIPGLLWCNQPQAPPSMLG